MAKNTAFHMQWIVFVSILQHCDANPRSYFDAATLFTGYNHIHPISEGRQGRSYKLVNGANSTLLGKKIDPSRWRLSSSSVPSTPPSSSG